MKRHLIQARALLIAAAVIAALAAVSAFQPLEEASWALRNNLFPSDVSGKVVLVKVDGETEEARINRLGQTINALSKLDPKRVLLATDAQSVDRLLKAPVFRAGMVELGPRLTVPLSSGESNKVGGLNPSREVFSFIPALNMEQTATSSPFGMVWHYAYGADVGQSYVRSEASIIAEVNGKSNGPFLIDYSYRMNELPIFSVDDDSLIAFDPSAIQHKSVILSYGGSAEALRANLPGQSFLPTQNYLHAFAAETLLEAVPVALGFTPALLLALVLLLALKPYQLKGVALGAGWSAITVLSFGVPWLSGMLHYNFEVTPALALLATGLTFQMRANWKSRVKLTSKSGAPSFDAFGERLLQGGSVIVARVSTWTDIQSAVSQAQQTYLCTQITRRLKGTDEELHIYHNGEESFCWQLPEHDQAVSEHLLGLRAIFESPFSVADKDIDVNLVFGVANVRAGGIVTGQLLAQAQGAALNAERLGIVSQTFDHEKTAEQEWHLALHTNIDRAIANGEIWVAYQPKLDLRTNRVVGAEALVRWTHPTRGNIPPSEFILHVERSGRIDTLTRAVIRDAVTNVARIHASGRNFNVSINLSPALFENPNLVSWLTAIVDEQDVPSRSITWEVTETREIRDMQVAKHALDRLRELGYRISLDDFGTGAANMEVLSHLPFDEIKIDQRFVGRMSNSSVDRAIVDACIALGKQANIAVIAEGVENEETLDRLRSVGCDSAQGYFIGRPERLSQMAEELGITLSAKMGLVKNL